MRVPLPTDVRPMMKPTHDAEGDGAELHAPRHLDVLAAVLLVDVEDDLHDEEHADHHQRRADGPVQDGVDEVAVVVLDVGDGGDAGEGRRHAAEAEPERQGDVHRTLAPVLPRAGDLGDGGVGDVGADRHRRREAEDEDQHRRHERAAAHAGEPDEEADHEAGDAEVAVQVAAEREVHGGDEERPAAEPEAPADLPGVASRRPSARGRGGTAGWSRRSRGRRPRRRPCASPAAAGVRDGRRRDRRDEALLSVSVIGPLRVPAAPVSRRRRRMAASMGARSLSVK